MAEERVPTADNTDFAARAGDTYTRLREMFAIVAELDESARAEWLMRNVPDAEERTALQSLLDADRSENGYLDIPADEHAARMIVDESLQTDGLIGQRIGAFRLARLLGKGGMAAVFLGEREDGDFRQRVAIKLLRRGLYSEIEQRLFRRERQLLAGLEHPNIAHLVDGGVTNAGIPYLVMEYVDGSPITLHARERGLGVRQRLELFLVVCRAVEAAHRALVVHRDIKPSNILVTANGTVKLLDFGIAKLLEDDAENSTVGVFTPDYAAPEQLSGAPVTTATDVYALGVLLHELLLGLKPHGKRTRRPSSLAVGLRGDTAAVKPLQLARALRGDLDTILLKCLAEEPVQRYASAGTLADDIRRHLDGKAVEAHPPSRWYRTRKFLRRHRGIVAITGTLVVAVLAGFGIALWQADVARYAAARANRVRDFMEDMFAPIENSVIEAKQTSVHDLLANATDKLDKNRELTVAERVDLQMLFSRLHEKMGESDQAQALAKQAAQLAEQNLHADDPQVLQAQILYAYSLLEHDDAAHAEPMLNALAARVAGRQLLRGGPLVMLDDGLAEIADMQGHHDVALDYERSALRERLAEYGADSPSAATGYNNLAISLDLSGHHTEAIDAFRNSFAAHLRQEGPDSLETANARNNLAMAELQAGRLQESKIDYFAGESLYDAAPNNKRNRNARYWQDRCQLAIAIGGADLKSTCERSTRITQEVIAPGDIAWHARAQRLDAYAKFELGDLDGAQQSLQKADDLLTATANASARASDDYLHGELDVARDDPAAAARNYAHAVERIDHGFPEYLRLRALAGLAMVCMHASQTECPADSGVARSELDASGDLWNAWLLPAHVAIARIDLDGGRVDAAIERLQSAIVRARPEMDRAQVHLLSARAWLAVAEVQAGHCADAKAELREVSDAMHGADPATNPLLTPAEAALSKVDPACAINNETSVRKPAK